MSSASGPAIVHIDDDPVDRRATARALRRAGVTVPILGGGDGAEGLLLLANKGQEALAWPFVVLLDINMPRMNGIEFLRRLRNDQTMCSTVVFVLTTSDEERDLLDAYDHQIAGYLVKEDAEVGLGRIADLLASYTQMVKFPTIDSRAAARD